MASVLRSLLAETGLDQRFAGYHPQFSLEEFADGHWWVKDGDVRVGLVVQEIHFAELVNFDPLHPLHDITFPAIYHAPTMPGDRITMAKWVKAQSTTSDDNALTFTVQDDHVTVLLTERWANGRTATTRLTWQVDPDFGYVLACEAEMHSPEPESHEYCNFLPKGTTDDRPGFARYPYVLWQHPDGRIVRWNQNNVSARALGAMDEKHRRRIATGGFIGFFGEADRNSAIEILESTPGSTAITCPNMLDEHISWVPKELAQYDQDAEGKYLSRAVYTLVSVPPQVGDVLTARAEMLDLVTDRYDAELMADTAWCAKEYPCAPGTPKRLAYYPMQRGQVADFETKLDPASTFRGSVFNYPDAEDSPEAPVAVVADTGHSGTHALRLRVAGDRQSATVYGNCFHVTEGQRYRLSAWIKADLTEGSAVLRAQEFLYSPRNTTADHRSAPLTGRQDWQQVAVEFVPGPQAHVVGVHVEVEGHGTVWVDDVLLSEA